MNAEDSVSAGLRLSVNRKQHTFIAGLQVEFVSHVENSRTGSVGWVVTQHRVRLECWDESQPTKIRSLRGELRDELVGEFGEFFAGGSLEALEFLQRGRIGID